MATLLLTAVNPSIWSVALENALTDDDSYVNKGRRPKQLRCGPN